MNLQPLEPVAAGTDDDIRIIEPLCAVFRRKLKAEGLKYTPERAYILDAVIRRAMDADRDAAAASDGRKSGPSGAKASGREVATATQGTGPGGVKGGRGGVFEAEELVESMGKQGFRVSRATVYRTIKLLAEAGIIQQVLFDTEQAHYQLAYGRAASGLLVEVESGEITPIDVPELAAIRDRVCRERGLVAEGHRLVIYGRRG